MTPDPALFDRYTKRIRFKDEKLGNILRVINLQNPDIRLETTPELWNRTLTVTFSNDTPEAMAELDLPCPRFEENTTGQHDPFIQLTIKCYLYSEANDSDFSPSLSVLLDAFCFRQACYAQREAMMFLARMIHLSKEKNTVYRLLTKYRNKPAFSLSMTAS